MNQNIDADSEQPVTYRLYQQAKQDRDQAQADVAILQNKLLTVRADALEEAAKLQDREADDCTALLVHERSKRQRAFWENKRSQAQTRAQCIRALKTV